MNIKTISFSTSATSISSTASELKLNDLTSLTINLSGIVETQLPLFLTINWGDGHLERFQSSFTKDYRVESIIPEILYNKLSSLLSNTRTHLYYPSISARYKKLSAEINIEYINGDVCSIIQPINIVTSDYFESIGDMKHIHTNILQVPGNNKQFIFSVDKGGFLIESES